MTPAVRAVLVAARARLTDPAWIAEIAARTHPRAPPPSPLAVADAAVNGAALAYPSADRAAIRDAAKRAVIGHMDRDDSPVATSAAQWLALFDAALAEDGL